MSNSLQGTARAALIGAAIGWLGVFALAFGGDSRYPVFMGLLSVIVGAIPGAILASALYLGLWKKSA